MTPTRPQSLSRTTLRRRPHDPAHDPHDGPVVVANPSFDLYGADLQMLESVRALRGAGRDVVVVAPTDGPLRPRLEALGARTAVLTYPVLRRADATPLGILRLALAGALATLRVVRFLRRVGAGVLYVNTVTLPWCLAAGRAARVPVLCHVHEAEPDVSRVVGRAMAAPLLLSHRVLVNSLISRQSLLASQPRLEDRTVLVYNGVPAPPDDPEPATFGDEPTLLFVGRLSPRKAPHVALEAAAILRAAGRRVRLVVAGTPVPGQEDYVERMRERAGEADLVGAVDFPGYVSPVWPLLHEADVFVATSTAEPFGNAVVEAQLARRAVVASAVEGHLETVEDAVTGVHVPVGDADALAAAVDRLLADPGATRAMADLALARAHERFGVEQYAAAVVDEVVGLLGTGPSLSARG